MFLTVRTQNEGFMISIHMLSDWSKTFFGVSNVSLYGDEREKS